MRAKLSISSPGFHWVRFALGSLGLTGLVSLGACVVTFRPVPVHEVAVVEGGPPPGEVVATEAPPPPQTEVVAVAPGPGFVWVGGYWGWGGSAYVWVPGGWHRPPRAGAVWVGGYWRGRPGGGHVWVRGGWR